MRILTSSQFRCLSSLNSRSYLIILASPMTGRPCHRVVRPRASSESSCRRRESRTPDQPSPLGSRHCLTAGVRYLIWVHDHGLAADGARPHFRRPHIPGIRCSGGGRRMGWTAWPSRAQITPHDRSRFPLFGSCIPSAGVDLENPKGPLPLLGGTPAVWCSSRSVARRGPTGTPSVAASHRHCAEEGKMVYIEGTLSADRND
jgi:hypothetical protein